MVAAVVLLFILLVPAAILVPPCTGAAGDYILFEGETLRSMQGLAWGSYSLVMQANCNLVLYDDSTALWSSQTGGKGRNCYVTLQKDANLVLYSAEGNPLWQSFSSSPDFRGSLGYILVLQKDGNAVIYGRYGFYGGLIAFNQLSLNSTAPIKLGVESVPEPSNILYPGETLKTGESLIWKNLTLTMEKDCKLALYDSNKYVSSIDNSGKGFTGCYLECENYGNAAIFDSKGTRLWGTRITNSPKGNYVLILRRDRTMGTFGPDRWSTNWDGLTHSSGEKIAMVTKD